MFEPMLDVYITDNTLYLDVHNVCFIIIICIVKPFKQQGGRFTKVHYYYYYYTNGIVHYHHYTHQNQNNNKQIVCEFLHVFLLFVFHTKYDEMLLQKRQSANHSNSTIRNDVIPQIYGIGIWSADHCRLDPKVKVRRRGLCPWQPFHHTSIWGRISKQKTGRIVNGK